MIDSRTEPITPADARAALDALANDDRCSDAIRSLLISDDAFDRDNLAADLNMTRRTIDAIAVLIDAIDACLFADPMTDLLLAYSLCPLHRIDYAICFDDATDECAAIRRIHDAHDT